MQNTGGRFGLLHAFGRVFYDFVSSQQVYIYIGIIYDSYTCHWRKSRSGDERFGISDVSGLIYSIRNVI